MVHLIRIDSPSPKMQNIQPDGDVHHNLNLGVSKNRDGPPKWMVYNGKTLWKTMIWGENPLFSANNHLALPRNSIHPLSARLWIDIGSTASWKPWVFPQVLVGVLCQGFKTLKKWWFSNQAKWKEGVGLVIWHILDCIKPTKNLCAFKGLLLGGFNPFEKIWVKMGIFPK